MSTFSNISKSSSSSVNQSKNSSTFAKPLRHGKEPTIGDIADKTFTDTLYPDGSQIKDLTFTDLSSLNQTWTNPTKN